MKTPIVLSLLLAACLCSTQALLAFSADYKTGVAQYRQGQYEAAATTFTALCSEDPNNIEARYYSALSYAQLGRMDDARVAYQTVIRMAPGTKAAKLSQEGLNYLPLTEDGLDKPPTLNSPTATAIAPASNTGVDPQALQMMMMMSAMGGGKGGGNAMMMLPLLQNMGGQNGQAAGDSNSLMNPQMIQQMLEQQMMGDMGSLFENNNDK